MPLNIRLSDQAVWQGQPWFEVEGGPLRFRVHRRHFVALSSPDEQAALARTALAQVVIETSSYCNRTCVFCPNKDGLRTQAQTMPMAVYERIVDDLARIQFGGSILLHLYNEPLADGHIFPYIERVRDRLRGARPGLNTNGDYLDRDMLDRLAAAGLQQLNVSIYGRNPGHFNAEHIQDRIDTLVSKLGLQPLKASGPLNVLARHGAVSVRLFGQDFSAQGYDRGGLVSVGLQRPRISPCASPFKEILIGHDGSVVPCCNIHPGSPEHSAHIVGRVTPDRGILEIFAAEPLAAWRRALLLHAPHQGPCARCTRAECGPVGADEHAAYEAACNELLRPQIDTPREISQ